MTFSDALSRPGWQSKILIPGTSVTRNIPQLKEGYSNGDNVITISIDIVIISVTSIIVILDYAT